MDSRYLASHKLYHPVLIDLSGALAHTSCVHSQAPAAFYMVGRTVEPGPSAQRYRLMLQDAGISTITSTGEGAELGGELGPGSTGDNENIMLGLPPQRIRKLLPPPTPVVVELPAVTTAVLMATRPVKNRCGHHPPVYQPAAMHCAGVFHALEAPIGVILADQGSVPSHLLEFQTSFCGTEFVTETVSHDPGTVRSGNQPSKKALQWVHTFGLSSPVCWSVVILVSAVELFWGGPLPFPLQTQHECSWTVGEWWTFARGSRLRESTLVHNPSARSP